jgi:replicative DNA helicase
MQSLNQGRRKVGDSGEPIPTPFPQLDAARISFRKGQLALVAAPPGTGKSAFVFYTLVIGWFRKMVSRVLYFSADTDAAIMFKRAAQMLTGWTAPYIEETMAGEHAESIEEIVRNGTAHIRMDYTPFPTDDDVRDQILAYYEVYGTFPDVIVMDNLSNLRLDNGAKDEVAALQENCEFLHLIAKETGAAVITLHHVVGAYEDGDKPTPLGGLKDKVSKTPESVFTLFRDSQHLYVSAVKNRDGGSDPSGRSYVALNADLSTMSYS